MKEGMKMSWERIYKYSPCDNKDYGGRGKRPRFVDLGTAKSSVCEKKLQSITSNRCTVVINAEVFQRE